MATKYTQSQIISSLTSFIADSGAQTVNDVPADTVIAFLGGLKAQTIARNIKANTTRNEKKQKLNDTIWKCVKPLLTYEPKKAIYFAETVGEVDGEQVSANRVARIFTNHPNEVEKVSVKGGCGYKLVGEEPTEEPEEEPTEEPEEEPEKELN